MSADSLNAAPAPTNTAEARVASVGAAAPAHLAHKGPAVGFEALLAMLTSAQDQAGPATAGVQGAIRTGVAADAAGKLTSKGLPAGPAKDKGVTDKEAAAKDSAAKEAAAAGAAGAAVALDGAAAHPDPAALVVQPAPAPVAATAKTAANPTDPAAAPVGKAIPGAIPGLANAPVAAVAGSVASDEQVKAADGAADAAKPAAGVTPLNFAKLDTAIAVPAESAGPVRTDLPAAKPPATGVPAPAPAAPAATPAAGTAPAAPAAPQPTADQAAVAAPSVTAEATQAATTVAPAAPKDSKAVSRYARNEMERSRAALATTSSAPAAGSAISAKMGDVVQSAAQSAAQSGTDAQALALSSASGDDAKDAAPALAGGAEASETATPAGSADLNAATTSTTAPATVTHAAAAPVRGEPQTVANMAAQIIKKLDGRSTRFDVALDPIGLGHVDVRVEIGAHGRMTAAMAFDTPQAAAELRGRAGELKTALEQAGFDISGGMSFDVSSGGGQQSQGSASQDNQQAPVFRGRAFQTALDTVVDPAAARPFQYSRSSASGVDIRI